LQNVVQRSQVYDLIIFFSNTSKGELFYSFAFLCLYFPAGNSCQA